MDRFVFLSRSIMLSGSLYVSPDHPDFEHYSTSPGTGARHILGMESYMRPTRYTI
jgi:hypothetical protein